MKKVLHAGIVAAATVGMLAFGGAAFAEDTADVPGATVANQDTGTLPLRSIVDQLPVGELPVGELPLGQLPTGQLPTDQLPTGQLPTGQLPGGGLANPGDVAGQLPLGDPQSQVSSAAGNLTGQVAGRGAALGGLTNTVPVQTLHVI